MRNWGSGEWGIVIGVAAILLVLPLNFLSNWLWPKWQNTVAARSKKKTEQRMAELTATLARISELQILNDFEVMMLKTVGIAIWASFSALQVALLIAGSDPQPCEPSPRLMPTIRLPFALAAGGLFLMLNATVTKIVTFRRERSIYHRQEISETIAELKRKLPEN